MKNFLYCWSIAFCAIVILDIVWFSLTVERFYKPYLGHVISGNFQYGIAAIFYVLYSFGIVYLVVMPSIALQEQVWQVACKGFVLGLVSYAAYNLTNQATIANWPQMVTLIDTLWGATLTASVASVVYYIQLIV